MRLPAVLSQLILPVCVKYVVSRFVESLANDDWLRGGNIVAFREGPGQEIFVEHFADLVVHHTGDELRADAPHARCYLERHIRRHKPKDEQKRLQVQAGAWRKGTALSSGGWRAKRAILPDKWQPGFATLRFMAISLHAVMRLPAS